jgi:hypothetical protein
MDLLSGSLLEGNAVQSQGDFPQQRHLSQVVMAGKANRSVQPRDQHRRIQKTAVIAHHHQRAGGNVLLALHPHFRLEKGEQQLGQSPGVWRPRESRIG